MLNFFNYPLSGPLNLNSKGLEMYIHACTSSKRHDRYIFENRELMPSSFQINRELFTCFDEGVVTLRS